MHRHVKSIGLAAAVLLIGATPAFALEYTIWHSPRTLESTDSFISVIPGLQAASSEVTFSGTGDGWIQLPLTIPSNVTVTGVTLCYEVSNPASYISQIRIQDMTTPDFATVRLDDPTDRTSTTPECIVVPTAISFDATLNLRLRIFAANLADVIKIGGIGIVVDDGVGSAPESLRPAE